LASAVAMAAPIPRAPPVTKALWPDNCPLMAVLPLSQPAAFACPICDWSRIF
jgi:hypothetical protein